MRYVSMFFSLIALVVSVSLFGIWVQARSIENELQYNVQSILEENTTSDLAWLVVDGQSVTISGRVDSEEKKKILLSSLRQVVGIASISDQLEVVAFNAPDRSENSKSAMDQKMGERTVMPITSRKAYRAQNFTQHSDAVKTTDNHSVVNAVVAYAKNKSRPASVLSLASTNEKQRGREIKEELAALNALKITFAQNSEELTTKSKQLLSVALDFLIKFPNAHLEIGGHTDSWGSEDVNQRLSARRAQSVADYLIENGIGNSRLIAEGYGETRPITSNDSLAGRIANRRIEFTLTE